MLRVSSPGLRCFRHPQQSSRARWLTQVAPGSVSAATWKGTTRTLPDRHHGQVHTEPPNKIAQSQRRGMEARREGPVGRDVKRTVQRSKSVIEKRAQSFRGPASVGPLVTPVQPILKIYQSCRCRNRKSRSVDEQRTYTHTLEPSRKASSGKKTNIARSTTPEVHHSVTDAEQQVFASLFRDEARLPLQRRRMRYKHLRTLATTNSLQQAWSAYVALSFSEAHEKSYFIPWEYLHRLVRVISATRPRVRAHFECLLDVLSRIHETGGKVQMWEWNILIDAAGKGLRKTTEGQFKDALSVYDDFLNNRSPGASLRVDAKSPSKTSKDSDHPRKPNERTLATVLHLASRTHDDQAFAHAVSLLQASGVRPDRVIYLTLMERHSRTGNLSGIRAVISEMQRRNMELGLEGWTLYMWALARSDRMDQAESIFAALRGNAMAQVTDEVNAARAYLESMDLSVPTDILPDEVTYTAMVQAYAYHGQFRKALQTFVEMVKALQSSPQGDKEVSMVQVDALLPVYRAIFLGFSRHSQIDVPNISPLVRDSRSIIRGAQGWSLSACERILDDWLHLPHKTRPNAHTIYWALKSFDVLSGGDPVFLKSVVERLEQRFELKWGGRLSRFIEERVNDRLPRN